MDTVNVISSGANALSTFGLYAICVTLVVVVVHLYRRVNMLEEKLRQAVEKSAEERGKELAKWQETTSQTQEVIKANTKALERFLAAIENGRR